MLKKIQILDSTLRDGAQGEGISFSVSDKLNIVRALDQFGINYIEAGNPSSNSKDMEFFEKVHRTKLNNSKLCAFGSTKRLGTTVEDDTRNLIDANTPVVVIFGKSWLLHVTEILRISPDDNLNIIEDTVRYLKAMDKEVIFDAEHFFDGYKADSKYALSVLQRAKDSGADTMCLCDTNGGCMPNEIYDITMKVVKSFPDTDIGIHCHNDSGCGVANTIMAVMAGATHVQGTFTGFGERCGNADLSTVIPNLLLKCNMQCDGNLNMLYQTAHTIAEISNTKVASDRPYTGKKAFTHKAGMHIDGVLKVSGSFEHVSPQTVGNKRNFLMSEISGRGAIISKIQSFAPEITKDSPQAVQIVNKLKELEHFGYQFEAAEASFELMVKKILAKHTPHFSLVFYKTIGEFPAPEGEQQASAMIKVNVDNETEITAAMGNGPVNALDKALRKALSVFYPELSDMYLTDYKVRVIDQKSSTGAKVRVLVETSDKSATWATIGVSNDIIEASLIALIDSIEYKLSRKVEAQ